MTDYSQYADSSNQVCLIKTDVSGNLTYFSRMSASVVADHLVYESACIPILSTEAAKLDGSMNWTYLNGMLTKKEVSFDLPSYKTQICSFIDSQAELARAKWITEGPGQSMVYQAKADQASKFLAQYTSTTASSATSTDWPFLAAEIGITADNIYDVAVAINTIATSWITVAASIENLRLSAKKNVNLATTKTAVDAAKTVTWPQPS